VRTSDAALDVLTRWRHVRLAALEVVVRSSARWPAHRRDDEIASLEVGTIRVLDDADGLVPEYLILFALGIPAVTTTDDLMVGAVDADPESPNQDFAVVDVGSRNIDDARPLLAPLDRDRTHLRHLLGRPRYRGDQRLRRCPSVYTPAAHSPPRRLSVGPMC